MAITSLAYSLRDNYFDPHHGLEQHRPGFLRRILEGHRSGFSMDKFRAA